MTSAVATDEIRTAFVTACCTGDMHTVRQTIARYPDIVNWSNPERLDRSPLIEVAIGGKHVDIAQVLINHGADASWQDSKGQTALHHIMYITCGDLAFIALLINGGTDETLKDQENLTIEGVARIASTQPYKDALKDALAARAELRANQQAQAQLTQDLQAQALEMLAVTRIESLHNRRQHDGERFKFKP